ncbi:MAG: DUF1573 domain-containing protein [Planctomycetes bacterium]|nr:DUF1573 domain-containing protein [Planctomycetota bacterium]
MHTSNHEFTGNCFRVIFFFAAGAIAFMMVNGWQWLSCNPEIATVGDLPKNRPSESSGGGGGEQTAPRAQPGNQGAQPSETRLPRLTFSHTEIDFGEVAAGRIIETIIVITNEGEGPASLVKPAPNCGCISAFWPSNANYTLQPRQGLSVRIQVDTSRTGVVGGPWAGYVTFSSNDPERGHFRLDLRASITQETWRGLIVTPAVLDVGVIEKGEAPIGRFEIENRQDAAVSIVQISPNTLPMEPVVLQPKEKRVVEIPFRPMFQSGIFDQTYNVMTDPPYGFNPQIRVTGYVAGGPGPQMSVSPMLLDVGAVAFDEATAQRPGISIAEDFRFTVTNSGGEPIIVRGVPIIQNLENRIEIVRQPSSTIAPGESTEIVARLREDAAPGPFRATFQIRTGPSTAGATTFAVQGYFAGPGGLPEIDSVNLREIVILYASDFLSNIESCDCHDNQLGGIGRLATAIREEKDANPEAIFITGGDLVDFDEARPHLRLRAEALRDSLPRLGVDVFVPGERELSYGAAFFEQPFRNPGLTNPLVLSNYAKNEPVSRARIFERKGLRIAVLSIVHEQFRRGGDDLSPALEALENELNRIADQADAFVVVAHMHDHQPPWNAPQFADLDLVYQSGPRMGGNTFQSRLLPNGVYLVSGSQELESYARTSMYFDDARNRLEQVTTEIPLSGVFAEDEQVSAIVSTYHERLRAVNARPTTLTGAEDGFVGSETCGTCHVSAAQVWSAARHSHAYESLVESGSQGDPECLACHTTGYLNTGGYDGTSESAHLASVGCEQCHGPSASHVRTVQQGAAVIAMPPRKPNVNTCSGCHTRKHSPSFNFDQYWPRIRHGK